LPGTERRLAQAHCEPRADDLDLRKRKLSRGTHEISSPYRGAHRTDLDEWEDVCRIRLFKLKSTVLTQQFAKLLVRATMRIVADSDSLGQDGATQDIIGSPVLQKNHQPCIDVASAPRVR
jgi:hypothetical protein